MSNDEQYVGKKVPGRIYGSKSFPMKGQPPREPGDDTPPRRARYLDRVFPDVEGDVLGIVKHEVVLRKTPTGKRQIKLYVVEDPRHIRSLVLQNFDMSGGKDNPSPNTHFLLFGSEIDDLLEIASLAREGDFQVTGKFRIGVNQLQRLDLTPEAVRALIGANTELLEGALRSEVTEKDVVAVAYRKQQVRHFEALLSDPGYFRKYQTTAPGGSTEAVWQKFFEDNQWIFGGSLFLSSTGAIDTGKLERVVAGSSVSGPGKEADGLLRTRGRIGALCFVEIKCHTTPLISQKATPYRPGVWPPSEELVGAISQVQRTVQLAEQAIGESLRPTTKTGDPTGEEAYLVRPRSVVVCGDLEQFISSGQVNKQKYMSFELFRRHLQGPEVVTFDELLERAKLLVDSE